MQNTRKKIEYLVKLLKLETATEEEKPIPAAPPLAKPAAFNEHDVPHLLEILQNSTRIAHRTAAAKVLGKLGIGGKPVVRALIAAMEDNNHLISKTAMLALVTFPNALPELVNSLQSSSSTVQMRAIRTLQGMGKNALPAVAALGLCLEQGDVMVRMCAKMAIDNILKESA